MKGEKSMEEISPERQEIFEKFSEIKNNFERDYGIELSNIEGVGLRKIVEKCLADLKKIKSGIDHFELEEEAIARFLNEFYGINYQNVPMRVIIDYKGKHFEVTGDDLNDVREKATSKIIELHIPQGWDPEYVKEVPTKEFREHLKIQQEKSHKI